MFENLAWIIWLIAAVFFIVAEIFTLGFVLFWFGIGALVGALLAYLGFSLWVQFFGFAIVSVAMTLLSRSIFHDYYPFKDEEAVLGVDALTGKVGTVSHESAGALNEGRVKVAGSTWKAFHIGEGKLLREGEKVEVVRVEGSTVYVKSAEKELPDWRGN